jgi:hypothetical protein
MSCSAALSRRAEFLRKGDLTILDRRQGEAKRRPHYDDVLFSCPVTQCKKGLALVLLKRLVDGPPPCLIVLALKHGRQCGLEVIDQLADRGLKCPRPAGGQFDGDRFVRVCEIVDIDPMGSARLGRGLFGQNGLDRGLHAIGTNDEQTPPCRRPFRSGLLQARAPAQRAHRSARVLLCPSHISPLLDPLPNLVIPKEPNVDGGRGFPPIVLASPAEAWPSPQSSTAYPVP